MRNWYKTYRAYKTAKINSQPASDGKSIYTQCMHCKKWKDEAHVFKHLSEMDDEELRIIRMIEDNWGDFNADFLVSHGICDDCIDKFY